MKIPTEPIGSIPRPAALLEGMRAHASGLIADTELDQLFESALKDTLRRLEATGSPVLTDGEQAKPSFATYPIAGLPGLNPAGVVIPFADGHQRQLPTIGQGPFRYRTYASGYLEQARRFTGMPLKQAVISVSALSLLYPAEGIEGYDRAQFLADLVGEAETDIRRCLGRAAHVVQIDFTEGRLALKLDPTGALLQSFIDLNNQVLSRFTEEERRHIGVHSCPGGDHDSTHSADVPYAALLPYLFQLQAGNFYLEYAAEHDKPSVLASIKEHAHPTARIFLGVTNVLDPRVETPEEVRDLIVDAAQVLPAHRLGTTDDCGFSPFADDTSTARDIAFAKIQARVRGTWLAEGVLK